MTQLVHIRDVRGNILQSVDFEVYYKQVTKQLSDLKDKLHRGNMQIKDLKEKFALVVDDLQKTRIKLIATEAANFSITKGALSK